MLRTLGADPPTGLVDADQGALPDRVADRYARLALLGRGGMGAVWRVHDQRLDREVALKVLRRDLARATAAERFREEVAIAARLEHPGIVAVHDLGQLEDGRPFYTMRLVRGETLESRIGVVHRAWRMARTDEGSSVRRLLEAFLRVCETVAYAHAAGVIHRDLKPSNVMLGPFGEVLVLDWGLARLLARPVAPGVEGTSRPGLTLPGVIAGTPAYMAPEQARGETDSAGPQADVHALGATLYDVLCERPPRLGRDARDLLARVARGAPIKPPSAVAPAGLGVDPELDRICLRALAAAPEDRYPHAGALAEEVAAWLDGTRRRERGARLVAEADEILASAEQAEAEAEALKREAAAHLTAVGPGAAAEQVFPAWDLEDRARSREADAADARARSVALLRAALSHAPDLPAAHDRLADEAQRRHRLLEAAGRPDEARAADVDLREHDRSGRHAAWLSGTGALTLVTDPPGAEVRLWRVVDRQRRRVLVKERVLGTTPLVRVPLPMGNWMCEIRSPGRVTVRYPVKIGRLEHWDGVRPGSCEPYPILLPARGELGREDHYVPAGWFVMGEPPHAPVQRKWADAFVVRRFPVTVEEYCVWLNATESAGGDIGPLLPRLPDSDDLLLERGPTGRWTRIRSDTSGLHWDGISRSPRAPILLLSWEQAMAYAAARGGWRLLAEGEWEKAARGVDARGWPWGDHFHPSWCRMKQTRWPPAFAEVGAHREDVSPYGVRDLAGNVMDWVLDPEPLPPAVARDPIVRPDPGVGQRRVSKGGGYGFGPSACRAAFRATQTPVFRAAYTGMRLGRSLE